MPVELTVWAHDPSDYEVYVDPAVLPDAREGDIAELYLPKDPGAQDEVSAMPPLDDLVNSYEDGTRQTSSSTGTKRSKPRNERRNLYFVIKKMKQTTKANLQTISVSSSVLNTLGIRARSQVRVRLLKSEEQRRKVYLDVVEIHFKGVYLTRGDHYKIAKSISGKCVNSGQRVEYLNSSVRLTVNTLYRGGKRKFSGFIGDDTRIVFRSDSARILIFIQMSSEMWNFDETGDIMFHRLVNSFIPEMLHRWHTQGDSHLVSIILFTSITRRDKKAHSGALGAGVLERETSHFYRVVVDSVHISRWSDIMRTLRSEFERFPQEVLEDPETHELLGYFLPSSKSNIVEAFSLATTLLTSKFVDRDLCRTGVQAMVATAGPACFDVDLSELWHLSRRLLGVEIGIELVCLARPPLHVTPLFRALLPAIDSDLDESDEVIGLGNWRSPADSRLVFCVPTWINMSFWVSPDKYMKQWIPRCRIYDLQMVGLIENESRALGLKSYQFEANELTNTFMKSFDAGVFKSVDMIKSQKRVESAAKTAKSTELKPRANGLDKGSLASAVTTVAVAKPTTSSPSDHFAENNVGSSSDVSADASNNTAKPSDQRSLSISSRSSATAGMAKLSLGALLSSQPRADPNKPRKSPSIWSISRSSNKSEIPTVGAPAHPQPEASKADTSEASAPSKDAPIYISTPAQQVKNVGRKPSEFKNMLSPPRGLRPGLPPSSPRSPARRFHARGSAGGTDASPPREKIFGKAVSASPPGLTGMGSGSGAMCDTSKPELQNPSMWRVLRNSATIDNPSRLAAYGRWANVYPPNKRLNGVSWHSLKSPASLPLTSESFPGLVSFRENHKFQFYDVAADSDEMSLSLLLDEMIGLRLQLGFQIAVGPSVRAVEASLPRGNPNRVVPIVPRQAKDCIGIRIYLTRMGLVHRLAVDDDHTVNVRLYTSIERNAKWLKSPINEGRKEDVQVKSRHDPCYKSINKRFLDQSLERLNWSMLDLQVSGADDPLLYPSSGNTQNLVAIRYVLLPLDTAVLSGNDTLTVEESHVEGITKIVRQLLRNRKAGSIDSDFIVYYYTGKLSKSIGEIVQDSSSSLELNRLNKSISLEDLAAEMQGAMGLQFRDRRWHWKQFKHVFTGHDFVVWVMKTFEDVSTAEDAEEYGADVMKRGLIRHPENRHPFIQGHYFYEITPQYSHRSHSRAGSDGKAEQETNGNSQDEQSGSTALKPEDEGRAGGDQTKPMSSNASPKQPKKNRSKVHVSESFVLNVDPRGISERPESVKVSIDRMHNPKNAFHILVEWLNVTPRLVDDLFSSAGRLASQYGLRLVQVPVADVSGSLEDSPFRSAMRVKPKIELSSAEESRWFHHYLLRRCGYVLDVYDRRDIVNDEYEVLFLWGRLKSASPQYIHNSGFVLVQLEHGDQFCITANTLHLSRAVLGGNAAAAAADSECESLMTELHDLCHDSVKLQSILDEGRSYRKQSSAASSFAAVHSGPSSRQQSQGPA